MSKSSHYTAKIRRLFRSLKRRSPKVPKLTYQEPIDAIVFAVLSETLPQSAAETALRKLSRHFVDWNDLRASRDEEVLDVLGGDCTAAQQIATCLSTLLQYIFQKYNTVSLAPLAGIGKNPARQTLEKIDGISRFVVNFVMLTALNAHAMPLTPAMLRYLRANQLVNPAADDLAVEGFLQRQIPAAQAYEFYSLLRRESETNPPTTQKAQPQAAKRRPSRTRTAKTKSKTTKPPTRREK
jgi:endonuclease III